MPPYNAGPVALERSVVKVPRAVLRLPVGIVAHLSRRGLVLVDDCFIYRAGEESSLRLKTISYTISQAYEELITRYGTAFVIYFIIRDGRLVPFTYDGGRFCPYAGTISHSVIHRLVGWS